jgi:hypothetical protein
MAEHRVPVVLEFILERVTNISMGSEIDSVNEFEEILCLDLSLSTRKSRDMGGRPGARQAAEGRRRVITARTGPSSTIVLLRQADQPQGEQKRACLPGLAARSAAGAEVAIAADELNRRL